MVAGAVARSHKGGGVHGSMERLSTEEGIWSKGGTHATHAHVRARTHVHIHAYTHTHTHKYTPRTWARAHTLISGHTPARLQAYNNLGNALAGVGRLQEAATAYATCIQVRACLLAPTTFQHWPVAKEVAGGWVAGEGGAHIYGLHRWFKAAPRACPARCSSPCTPAEQAPAAAPAPPQPPHPPTPPLPLAQLQCARSATAAAAAVAAANASNAGFMLGGLGKYRGCVGGVLR